MDGICVDGQSEQRIHPALGKIFRSKSPNYGIKLKRLRPPQGFEHSKLKFLALRLRKLKKGHFSLTTIKNMSLTKENFAESMSQMIDVLSNLKFTQAEINLTNLLVEEIFFSFEEGITDFNAPVSMNIYNRLGETKISLRFKGNPYNPLSLTAEESDDEIFSARMAILNANRDKISYTYKNGENIITIVAHRLSKTKKSYFIRFLQ